MPAFYRVKWVSLIVISHCNVLHDNSATTKCIVTSKLLKRVNLQTHLMVNRHTVRCTRPVVLQSKLVSDWTSAPPYGRYGLGRTWIFYVPEDDMNFSLTVTTYSTTLSRYGAFSGRDQYTVIQVVPEIDFIFRTTAVRYNNRIHVSTLSGLLRTTNFDSLK